MHKRHLFSVTVYVYGTRKLTDKPDKPAALIGAKTVAVAADNHEDAQFAAEEYVKSEVVPHPPFDTHNITEIRTNDCRVVGDVVVA